MDLGISGRNALVTGGSRGLGRQCALSLASEAVNVAICGRTRSTIDRTLSELEDMGVKALGVVADVMQIDDIPRLYEETVRGLGPPDILVNNAGGSAGATDLSDTPLENYRQLFDFNLFSGYELSRLALPHMQEQGWGRIINIASIYGREHGGNIGYMSAKAAVIAETKHAGTFARGQRRDGQLDRAWLDSARRRKLGAVPCASSRRRLSKSSSRPSFRWAGSAGPSRWETCVPSSRPTAPTSLQAPASLWTAVRATR